MSATTGVFRIERAGGTAVVTPLTDLRELGFSMIESGVKGVLTLLNGTPVKNIDMDFP